MPLYASTAYVYVSVNFLLLSLTRDHYSLFQIFGVQSYGIVVMRRSFFTAIVGTSGQPSAECQSGLHGAQVSCCLAKMAILNPGFFRHTRTGLRHLVVSSIGRIIRISDRSSSGYDSGGRSEGVSYSTIRDEFRKYLGQVVPNTRIFGLHSLKSAAVPNPGCRLLNTYMLDRPAGRNNPASKNRYIEYSVNDLLQVIKSLGL